MKTRTQYFYLFLFIIIGPFLKAQSYTVWQQGQASDYYYNIENSVNVDIGCDCYVNNDVEIIYLAGAPDFEIGRTQYGHPHSNQTTAGTISYEMGPDRLHNVFGRYSITGSYNLPGGGCSLPGCNGSTDSPSIIMSTDNPYAPTNVSHSWSSLGQITLNWDIASDIPSDKYSTLIYKNNTISSNLLAEIPGHATSWTDPNCASGTYIFLAKYSGNTSGQTTTRFSSQSTIYTLDSTDPDPISPPMGRISGTIETTNGTAVDSVLVEIFLQNPNDITNGTCWPSTYYDYTDATGAYTIPFIYWGTSPDQAQYLVKPTLENHGFNPGEVTVTLRNGDFSKVVDFEDTTAFAIQGYVFDSEGCGVDSALISTVSGGFFNTWSGPDGSYSLIVPETGAYSLIAEVDTFNLGTQSVLVEEDLQDINFDYLETDTLNLYVGAGCFEYIGQAEVVIRSRAGCEIKTVQTNLSGFAENIILPKNLITYEVTNIDLPSSSDLDPLEILADIGGEKLLNLDTTTTIEIFYRKPLSLEFNGIPAPPCPAINHPVFQQSVPYPITILVWESPGICLADTGFVVVLDNIATVGIEGVVIDTIPIVNGIAQYTIIPGEPILNAPFLKNITFTAVVDSSSTSTTIDGIVSGSRQRTETVVTGGPTELPYLILRDPPGDASFSEFMGGETVTYAQAFSAKEEGDVRLWGRVAGKSPKGPIRTFGEIGLGIKVGGSQLNTEETKLELSDFINIKTSAEESDIGRDHDIVYGAAVNFIYGLVDERKFDINTCAMTIDTGLMFSPDTFETKFFLSIEEIRDVNIPTLEIFANNPDTTEEARIKFRAELKKWEQVLQLNDELREEALLNPIDNLTLDDDVGFSFTTTGSSTKTKSIVTSQFVRFDIAAKAGLDILDETFVIEGGIEVNIRGEWGQSKSESITETTTTSFTFQDLGDDDDDLFSFDYALDPVYNTPVFGDPIGRSSCPHEMGTQFVDFPQVVALNPVQYAESGEDFLFFDIAMRNYSESGDARSYNLQYYDGDDGSAIVSFGGDIYAPGGIFPARVLAPGEEKIIRIKVEQNDPEVFSFEGFEFRMFPSCEQGLYSSTFISAFFPNDCPFISMPVPDNNFLINADDNNLMGVVMDDYFLNPNIDHIKLEYLKISAIGTTQWKDANIDIPGSNLIVPPQQYFWDVNNLEDGDYSIRWELKCGNTINLSPRINGTIDRKPPRVFGTEKPRDDTYFPGDDISVTFNEIIDILHLQNGNFYVTNMSTNQSVAAGISADGKTVYIDLGMNIDSLYNQSFEIGLIGVKDMYGNARPDTVKWDFIVSEPDSDRDGVGDLTDRCPGGDDCEDTDMDGIPDDCDCLPTIPQNGKVISKAAMHFDGLNDHIIIPHSANLVPTLFNSSTYETWIYPKESDNEHGFIAATGNFPNANHQIYFNNASNKIIVDGVDVGPLISTNTVPHNEWTHIAVVYNLNQTLLYINGELDKVRNQALSTTDLGNDVSIGNQASGNPNIWNFHGLMDEFRIWTTARTGAEIKSTMRKELVGNENLLALYFNFNEGIAFGNNLDLSVVENQSLNGLLIDNFGTLNNFEKTGALSNWGFSPQGILNAQYDLCLTCPDTLNAAIDLDGVNDYLSIPNNPALVPTTTNEMTFELWLNPSTPNTDTDVIIFIDANLYIARSANTVQIFSSQLVQPLISVPENQWTHLAFSFKTDSLMVLKDGQVEFSNAFSLNNINVGNPIIIGEFLTTPNLYTMDGKMDDIRFWDHARTPEQIRANMFHEMYGNEAGLEAYFDFNEGLASGDNKDRSFAEDKTGNGNNANFVELRQFGGYSNYVPSALNFRIDEDQDGRPDACDSCIPDATLTLENMTLVSGTYKARERITLGAGITINNQDTIYLRAPEIKVLAPINSPSSTRIYVSDKPCDE